ncbi:MAG: NAD(P)H-dependent flavin oxidoreductase [Bacteroidota bacterium]
MTGNIQKIQSLYDISYPIIQGGMVWTSGWKLASAVSNAGGLGLIGAGSMYPDVFREHVQKCKAATQKPFGVNIPLLYPNVDEIIRIVKEEQVKIVFTSAGNPAKYTAMLREEGITVTHVVANMKFALKSQEAGVDAIVAEGFEAGGHNGLEENTTLTLIPYLREKIDIPLIAAGGIGSGQAMAAAIALGADGVQIGSRFAATQEASSHPNFKNKLVELKDGDTQLIMKRVVPVRMVKNKFFREIQEMEIRGASREELKNHLGKGRAKKGMFEGDLDEGELEIGQVSASISEILPAEEVMNQILNNYRQTIDSLSSNTL